MTNEELHEALCEKLRRNLHDYQQGLLQLTPGVLIGRADEIAATNLCFNELVSDEPEVEEMMFLLQFENPLEVLRDQWQQEQNMDYTDEFFGMLTSLQEGGNAESLYALDPEWSMPQEGGQTIC